MSEDDWKLFLFWAIPISWFAVFGIGWCTGNDVTVKSTRQTLCREFMKETPDYINCNTKNLDNVINMIKEQTNEK
jgi:hypothetical protein